MSYNLDDYEPVDDRIHAWYTAHPAGRIVTRLEHHRFDDHGLADVVVSAAVYRKDGDTDPAGTGLAHEHRTDRGMLATSTLEVCETSAVGRALAQAGFSTKGKRPSREEMAAAHAAQQTTGGTPQSATGDEAGGAEPPGPASPAAPPTMGEAIGNVVGVMPGSRIVSQEDTPKRDHGHPTPATEAQFRKATALAKSVGLVERGPDGAPAVNARGYVQIDWNAFGRFAADVLGHPVTTIKGMGKADMSAVIDALADEEAKQADPANNPAVTDDPWAGEQQGVAF
jgi:hypothetical protein